MGLFLFGSYEALSQHCTALHSTALKRSQSPPKATTAICFFFGSVGGLRLPTKQKCNKAQYEGRVVKLLVQFFVVLCHRSVMVEKP